MIENTAPTPMAISMLFMEDKCSTVTEINDGCSTSAEKLVLGKHLKIKYLLVVAVKWDRKEVTLHFSTHTIFI